MPRSVPEWIGKTDDTTIPPRVRLRVFERDGGVCQCGCTWKIRAADRWETDHIVAIVNGGENRESNLHTLLFVHHQQKTVLDVAEKSLLHRRKVRRYKLGKRRLIPGSKGSGLRKRFNGRVWRERG